MKRSNYISVLIVSSLMIVAGCAQSDQPDDVKSSVTNNTNQQAIQSSDQQIAQQSSQNAAQEGRVVFIDPETGEITSAPPSGEAIRLSQTQSKSVNGSAVGVASKPQLMSDGSTKFEFNGQFNMPIKAVINESGEVEVGHHVDTGDQ